MILAVAKTMGGWNDDTTEPSIADPDVRKASEAHWERVNQTCLEQAATYVDAILSTVEVVHSSEIDENGFVNFLMKNREGVWWVSTTKNGNIHSGMPLDYFLSVGGPR